ncbi:putative ABC transporter permease [Candidatus Saccharibacteria bacterium]|nr:putative ABC transporter permease [Candidatus Saccharibacteria bacterium]
MAKALKFGSIRQWAFWRDTLIWFFVASWVGHWLEITLFHVTRLFDPEHYTNFGILDNWLEPYPIYGWGVVAIIVIYRLLPERLTSRLPLHFLINLVLMAVVEYVGALLVIRMHGENTLWDYTNKPFNIHGYICLQNTLLFAAAATVFSYGVYPRVNALMQKASDHWRDIALILLAVAYMVVAIVY